MSDYLSELGQGECIIITNKGHFALILSVTLLFGDLPEEDGEEDDAEEDHQNVHDLGLDEFREFLPFQ